MDIKNEKWVKAAGNDRYEVSNIGRIRSIDWVEEIPNRWGTVTLRNKRGKIIKPYKHKNGYSSVILAMRGPRFLVHRMIAESFIGPIPNGYEVHHKNGERSDNRIENLEIITIKENRNKRNIAKGDRSGVSKLCNRDINEIKNMVKIDGKTFTYVANQFGVNRQTISNVVNGRNWRHV